MNNCNHKWESITKHYTSPKRECNITGSDSKYDLRKDLRKDLETCPIQDIKWVNEEVVTKSPLWDRIKRVLINK
jgi:hypothetical protein